MIGASFGKNRKVSIGAEIGQGGHPALGQSEDMQHMLKVHVREVRYEIYRENGLHLGAVVVHKFPGTSKAVLFYPAVTDGYSRPLGIDDLDVIKLEISKRED